MDKWTRWQPTQGLSGKYYIDSLIISKNWDLIVQLSNQDETQSIEITFKGSIDAYRYTNESFCFATFGDLSAQYGTEFYKDWSFFNIENSNYLKWLSERSRTVSDSFNFKHYCIFGGDEILDILAHVKPHVKILS